MRVHLCRCKLHFVCVVIAGRNNPAKDIVQFRVITDKHQKRLAAGAGLANTENVFTRRVETDDQQGPVEQNDACAQAIENVSGVFVKKAATGAFAAAAAGGRYRMVFCWTKKRLLWLRIMSLPVASMISAWILCSPR